MNNMSQQTFDDKEDEFVKSLNLTDDKIKEDLEKMRNIEGFPLGDVEDILELSEPPYYTSYPNPYIKDFIEYYGTPYDEETDDYDVEPFVGDVSEGKNNPIYRAHSYHTKVPHKAIMKFIEHYTEPENIVFDGFCGSGMTGIAAQNLKRYSILSDIAPSAGFISYNYNMLSKRYVLDIFKNWKKEIEKYYFTYHTNGELVPINYVVWSDVFSCPFCNEQVIFWDVALNEDKTKNLDSFCCPKCGAELNKKKLNKNYTEEYDNVLNEEKLLPIHIPVRIYYKYKNKSYFKEIDEYDEKIINDIDSMSIPFWVPFYKMLFKGAEWGDSWRAGTHGGIEHIHQFYLKRSLFILGFLFDKIKKIEDVNLKHFFIWVFTSINPRLTSKMARYRPGRGKGDAMSGILYIPSLQAEYNVLNAFESKLNSLSKLEIEKFKFIQTTQSSTDFRNIPENSIDYIFIDPPFGDNLMYSELNFPWESWLKVFTNNLDEAIISNGQNKDKDEYKELLINCFKHFFRILKPNRWITIEFHNSKAEIWNIIRESINKSGFVIAQVAILDKKQGTHTQCLSPGSVKNDLVINAYKPNLSFSKKFSQNYGFNLEVEFLDLHLKKLPIDANIERTEQMLYSKYLAQYLQNDFEVRLDSSDFSKLLKDNFIERDGFWFNEVQALEYENIKLKTNNLNDISLNQNILGISDEKSALIWLSQFLNEPKSYDDIYNGYIKNLMVSQDKIPELKELLHDNFVFENGKYKRPSNIEKSKIEEIRIKKLNKEFSNILSQISKSKSKIKEIRKEALIHGLTKLYNDKDVDTINLLGERIDKKIIESDEDISAIINWAKYK